MSPCVKSSALDEQNFKKYFEIILTGTSFQASDDIHSTIIDADALFALPLGVNA
jgi:hypothetical protein